MIEALTTFILEKYNTYNDITRYTDPFLTSFLL